MSAVSAVPCLLAWRGAGHMCPTHLCASLRSGARARPPAYYALGPPAPLLRLGRGRRDAQLFAKYI